MFPVGVKEKRHDGVRVSAAAAEAFKITELGLKEFQRFCGGQCFPGSNMWK